MREEVHFGFKIPLVSVLVDRLLGLVLPIDEFRRHIREEGENLAALFSEDPARGGKENPAFGIRQR
jgi:hypothetical protein